MWGWRTDFHMTGSPQRNMMNILIGWYLNIYRSVPYFVALSYSGGDVKFFGRPLFIFRHEVSVLQDRETFLRVRVSVATDESILVLQ